MRTRLTFLVAGATTFLLVTAASATAEAITPDADPLAAIQAVAPSVLDGVAQAPTAADGAVAVANSSVPKGLTVQVPTDPTDGILLGVGTDMSIAIGLPNAHRAAHAVSETPDVVSFDNHDGSTTVPVVKHDGSLQIATVIDDANAPERFAYPLLGQGQTIQLRPDGGAFIARADEIPLVHIATPWAMDANGASVPTRYEVHGNVLTQVVDHRGQGVTYPIVADPQYGCGVGWCSLYFDKSETRDIATAGFTTLGGAVAACGPGGAPAIAACGLAAGAIGGAAQYAENHGQCVGLSFWGIPPLVGWNPFAYSGPQCK